MIFKKLLLPGWVVGLVALFFYSYTQVDLSLTLAQSSIFQTIQKNFQYIGYFNRPLSTYLYIAIFAFLFFMYFATLKLVNKEKLTRKTIWTIIIFATAILTFTYSAFSYDIFNYIFDARIITTYGQNPYMQKALDFPGDPMLSFMHWTHRTYPYGPVWLGLTVPLTFIAQEFFLLTFFLFKILMAAFFILTVYFIGKVSQIFKLSNPLLPVAAFALNPFVLSESLVSAHNDIVMMGFITAAVYFFFKKQIVLSSIFALLSVGIKFATGFLAIPFAIYLFTKKQSLFIYLSLILMIIAVVVATVRTNFQPWYLLYPAPFTALLFRNKNVFLPASILSIVAVVYYIPYLYTGGWEAPIPSLLNSLMLGATLISVIIVIALLALRKRS